MNFIFGQISFFIFIFNVIVVSHAGEVICYYGSWAKNRPSNGKFTIENIEPKYCSIIIYCCIGLNEDATIKPYDSEGDLPKFVSLKNSNPNVKLLTAIGGPNEISKTYSTMAGSAELRSKFVVAILAFLKRHKLDGLDFMWEHPNDSGTKPADKGNFVNVLQMLRDKFNENNWLLSAVVGASKYLIDSSYDVIELNKVLDYINIKTFDYYSSSDPFVYVHSPLYAPENDSNRLSLTQNGTIWNWLEAGANRAKIILGIAAYGRSFQLASKDYNDLLAPSDGPGSAGPYSAVNGMLTYLEICEKLKKDTYNERYHDEIHAVSAYKGLEWIGFDNDESIEEKTNYAKLMRLGGVMLYWIDGDDKSNNCGTTNFPLLKTIRSFYPISVDSTTTTTTHQSSTTLETSTSTPNNQTSRDEAKEMCILRKYGSSFANPLKSCTNRYYRCLRIMLDDFIPRDCECSEPLVFDESIQKCNHRQYVDICKD